MRVTCFLIGLGFALTGALGQVQSQTADPPAEAPRPTFFEEERRLNTPTSAEVKEDKQVRSSKGFRDTFLTDALNGASDPGEGFESRGGSYSRTLGTDPNPPNFNFGIFARPPR